MAKKVKDIKMQLMAGKANPAPPVGTALGPTGVNMMDFCKQFNDKTKDKAGMVIPVVVTIYDNRTFSFILKSPPASVLIKKALGLEKGSSEPNKNKVGTLTKEKVDEIIKLKKDDLNSYDEMTARNMIKGTARSMGILVEDK